MRKSLRFVMAGLLLLGIILLAGNHIAAAGNLPWQRNASLQAQSASSAADAANKPGSVKPPPVVVPPITQPGTYSAGGVCTVIVESISPSVSLHANLLPFSTVHSRPKETERYLAGVCRLIFVKNGQGVTDITPADAVVKVCFAAIPNTIDKLYVYDDQNWFALDTTVQNGLACAPATKTGKYVLVQMPAP